jgi:hypothetical protein
MNNMHINTLGSGCLELDRLSERKLCEMIGIPQAQRRALVDRGVLRPVGREGCSLHDAIELAAYQRLAQVLLPREVAVAWEQLREALSRRVPSGTFDLVFDKQMGTAELAFNAREVRRLIAHERPVHLIQLGPRLREISDAFRRWSSVQKAPRLSKTQARRSRSGRV